MATTTNYSWTTPDDTALVKDGAAAIRSLGTAIDTTVFNNASAAIAKTIVDAKGDIIAATAADTVSRLAVGANDTVLTADSSTATGLKWAAPAGGGSNWSLLNSGGTALTGAATITVSGISGKDKIFVLVQEASSANASSRISIRLNTDTAGNYARAGFTIDPSATYTPGDYVGASTLTFTSFPLGFTADGEGSRLSGAITITGCNSSGVKQMISTGGGDLFGGTKFQQLSSFQGYYNSATVISSISVFSSTGNFDGGTVYVYTSAS